MNAWCCYNISNMQWLLVLLCLVAAVHAEVADEGQIKAQATTAPPTTTPIPTAAKESSFLQRFNKSMMSVYLYLTGDTHNVQVQQVELGDDASDGQPVKIDQKMVGVGHSKNKPTSN